MSVGNNTQRVRRGNKGWRSHLWRESEASKEADGCWDRMKQGTKQHTRQEQKSQSLALLQPASRCCELNSSRSNPVNELWKPWDVISGKKYARLTKEEFSASQKDLLPFQASLWAWTWGWSQRQRMMNKPQKAHKCWVPLSSWIPAPLGLGCWEASSSCLPHPDNALSPGQEGPSLCFSHAPHSPSIRSLLGQALWIRPHREENRCWGCLKVKRTRHVFLRPGPQLASRPRFPHWQSW